MKSASRLALQLSSIAAALVCVGILGCGSAATSSRSDPGAAGAPFNASANQPSGTAKPQSLAKPGANVAPLQSGMPTPPVGAQWSIYCQTVPGAGHVQRANSVRDQLVSQTPLKDWYVVHGEGQSTLYYGFYKKFDDPNDAESRRAQQDRKRIDALGDKMGNRPFKFASFVALDSPDPVAPPEWNLLNADGAYTLQIAAYTGNALRKQYALEAVRQFRAQGLEAYYFHGETTSSICIGAFPESALQRDQVVSNADGDPDQSFLQSTEPLPAGFAQTLRGTDNKPIRVVQDRPKVVDPALRAMMQQFPEHAINGEVQILNLTDSSTGGRVMKPADSFVVPIPHVAPSALSNPAVQGGEPMRVVRPLEQPGVGKLKSIGE